MLSNRLAFAVLGIACVSAAAGGGYLANRQAVPAPPTAAEGNVTAEVPAPVKAVQETEAVVTPAPEVAKPIEPPAAPAVRRQPRPSRPAEQARTPATISAGKAEPPVLDRTWPSSASASGTPPSSAIGPAPPEPSPSQAPAPIENRTFQEPVTIQEPTPPSFEDLVISADSVIGLQLEGGVTSQRARVEDRVEARVVRDVRVGRQVAVPAGSRALGSVMVVESGGKFKDRARLGIRFHTLVLGDGSRLPISTDTIYRYGDAPGDRSAKKIGGGAVAGAILGAIIGGAKGAAVGATAGAGGGTAMVMSGERDAAEFPSGTELTARILEPVTVTVDR